MKKSYTTTSSCDLPSTGFIREKQVLQFIRVSKSLLWLWVREGRFPRPIKLSPRVTCWRAESVRSFIENAGTDAGDNAA